MNKTHFLSRSHSCLIEQERCVFKIICKRAGRVRACLPNKVILFFEFVWTDISKCKSLDCLHNSGGAITPTHKYTHTHTHTQTGESPRRSASSTFLVWFLLACAGWTLWHKYINGARRGLCFLLPAGVLKRGLEQIGNVWASVHEGHVHREYDGLASDTRKYRHLLANSWTGSNGAKLSAVQQ